MHIHTQTHTPQLVNTLIGLHNNLDFHGQENDLKDFSV